MSIYPQKYGFVYIWYDRKNNRYYIGSHWGTEDDGYICSSRMMRQSYKRRPEDFKRRVIKRICTTRQDLLLEEERWLKMVDPDKTTPRNTTVESRKNVRYYNIKLGTQNQWWSSDEKRLTVGEKISKAKTGKSVPCTPEKAVAISEAKKGKPLTAEHRAALTGIKKKAHTDEWKAVIATRMKEQWSNGTRKRAEPKQKMTKEEQAKVSSDTLKSKWSDPEWAAKQKLALAEGAKKRLPRTEESKQRTRDTFARRKELRLQAI